MMRQKRLGILTERRHPFFEVLPWGCCILFIMLLMMGNCYAQGETQHNPGYGHIGYVDMKRLLDNAPQVVLGRQLLEQEFSKRDALLKQQEQQVSQLEINYQREVSFLTKADAAAKHKEIETLQHTVKKLREQMRGELNERSQTELDRRWTQIQDVIMAYARKHKYDLIIQSPVVYVNPSIDITDDILEQLKQDTGLTISE